MAGPGGREVGRVSVRVLPDTSAFGRSLEKYLQRMERSLRVEIPAVVDTDGVTRDVKRVADVAQRSAKVEIPATVDGKSLNARIAALAKRLSGHEITMNVDIDKGLARARAGIAGFGRVVSSLAMPVSLASMVPTLLGIGGAAVTAAGAINLLPGALSAAGIGLSAVIIGMQGFGDAMKNMGDPEKFAASLEKLAPAARETAVAIKDLGPAWTALRLDVQQQLFEGIGNTITQLGTTYLPILQNGLRQTAAAIGAMGQVAGKALMRPESIAAVNTMLDQTAQAFRNAIPALGDFLRGFLQIGAVGTTFLPQFATAVSDVARRFAEWATAAAQSGRLTQIIEAAIGIFRQLGAIIGNVWSILTGLFTAVGASGAGALASIERLTAGIAAFVHSAQGATAISQIFSGLGAAMAGIVPAVTQVISALTVALGPVIEQLGPAVGQLAMQLGTVLVQAIQLLAPLLLQMATFLNQNMQWIGPLAIGVGGLVAALAAIGPVISFVTGLANAFKLAGLAFRVLSVALMTNPFVALAAAVIAIAALIYSNWDSIKAFLLSCWEAIKSAASAFGSAVSSIFTGLWSRVTGIFNSAKGVLLGIGRAIWSEMQAAFGNGIGGLLSYVAALPGRILGALGNLGRLLWNAGADLVRGMINGVRSMISNLLATVRNMAASAVNTVKSWLGIASPSKVFRQLGQWTGEGFADGIERAAPDAITAAGDMARAVAATPVASPVASPFSGDGNASLQQAVTAGVLAGLHGARMQVDGSGVARLVNKANATNARR